MASCKKLCKLVLEAKVFHASLSVFRRLSLIFQTIAKALLFLSLELEHRKKFPLFIISKISIPFVKPPPPPFLNGERRRGRQMFWAWISVCPPWSAGPKVPPPRGPSRDCWPRLPRQGFAPASKTIAGFSTVTAMRWVSTIHKRHIAKNLCV
jgi:hypothetical protein